METQERNIVIGGMGEAEINPAWTPEEALESLCNVSEQCGYMTSKREWYPHHKIIEHTNENGRFYITYWHDVMETIDKVSYKRYWTKGE